jgi:hypothetical protein
VNQPDLQTIVAVILVPVIGFFLKSLHEDMKQMKEKVEALQVHLPTYYVQKGELKDLFERIYTELVEIKQELKHKEDKS